MAAGLTRATTTYTVSVVTGTVRDAGTDGNVSITIFGTKVQRGVIILSLFDAPYDLMGELLWLGEMHSNPQDDTGALGLRESLSFHNKFERGHTDIFKLEAIDIGEIKKVLHLQHLFHHHYIAIITLLNFFIPNTL